MTHAMLVLAASILSIPPPLAVLDVEMASARPEKTPAIVHLTALVSPIHKTGPIATVTAMNGMWLTMLVLVPATGLTIMALRPMKPVVSAEEAVLPLVDLVQLPSRPRRCRPRPRHRRQHHRLLRRQPHRLPHPCLPRPRHQRQLHALLSRARMEDSVPTLAQATSATALALDILDLLARMMWTNVLQTHAIPMLIFPTQMEDIPAPVSRDTLAMVFPAPRLYVEPTRELRITHVSIVRLVLPTSPVTTRRALIHFVMSHLRLLPVRRVQLLLPQQQVRRLAPVRQVRRLAPVRRVRRLAPVRRVRRLAPVRRVQLVHPQQQVRRLAPPRFIPVRLQLHPQQQVRRLAPPRFIPARLPQFLPRRYLPRRPRQLQFRQPASM